MTENEDKSAPPRGRTAFAGNIDLERGVVKSKLERSEKIGAALVCRIPGISKGKGHRIARNGGSNNGNANTRRRKKIPSPRTVEADKMESQQPSEYGHLPTLYDESADSVGGP
jgi:hypothetical protein